MERLIFNSKHVTETGHCFPINEGWKRSWWWWWWWWTMTMVFGLVTYFWVSSRGLEQIFVGNFPSFPLDFLLPNSAVLPSLAILCRTDLGQCYYTPCFNSYFRSIYVAEWVWRCEGPRQMHPSFDVEHAPETIGANIVANGTSVKSYKRYITYNGPNY